VPTTRANLDLQTDLKQPNVPGVGDDVANKDYVDTAVSGAAPDATSAPGGGVVGKATFDENFGLVIAPGVIARVKTDGITIGFDGLGNLQTLGGAVPDATSGSGGAIKGKVTFDSDKGLLVAAGVAEVKIDGSTVTFNGSGQLQSTVVDATSGSGGAIKGKVTFDSDQGLDVAAGVARVKVDGATVTFNPSGELEVVGGGGGSLGQVSYEAPFTRNITGITPVTPITLGTHIDAVSYPKAGSLTTGERFEFEVGDDYLQGNLEIIVLYRMSSAVAAPNNQIRISTQAEIINLDTGLLDTASYPDTPANLMVPDNSTAYVRQTVLTIMSGDFGRGDTISVAIKRIAGDGNDLHSGDWYVAAYSWRYTAVVDSRIAVEHSDIFSNAVGENPTSPVTLGTLVDAVNMPSASDAGCKFTFIIPDNWDGFSDPLLLLTFAMSSAVAGTLRIATYGEIVDVVTGTVVTLPNSDFDFNPAVSTGPQQRLVRAIPAGLLAKGNYVTLVVARRTAVGGNHAGDFYFVNGRTLFTIAPVSGFTAVVVTEEYLEQPVFGNAVGVVTTDADYPSFGGDFETYFRMHSDSAAGRVDASWAGRLAATQTSITQIRISVKTGGGASPQYQLKVYAEGSGAVPVYDSGLQPAPGVLTELVITAGMLSAQPTGGKRYHIVMEAHIDAGEDVLSSRPFVRQE